ncbi:TPA_asm: hypothetical protein GNB72_004742, partial [Salmonella enterica subsp. enterica serovar Heidelberg]|nr:hypothetical protein [Salmonella enterica subsp. enterica serovar Heidelberg str. CFSAN000578]HAE6942881.1 hypothetical protein [Salmonella enterica subsp. enterica serovar Heidelberg]
MSCFTLRCGFSHYHTHPISPDTILAITIITKVIITTLTGGITSPPAAVLLDMRYQHVQARYFQCNHSGGHLLEDSACFRSQGRRQTACRSSSPVGKCDTN